MFLNPLGLFALLGVPVVIALHLFRRRFQRRRVSALFLWEARTTTSLSGRRREKLLRSPSFWSELLAALLLGFAFAGPRACGELEARHLVVVLDGSASMGARAGLGGAGETSATPSFAELARERLAATLRDLPGGSRVTVVESGPRPRILIGPAAFPAEALGRLAEERPSAGRHDLAPATALALQLAGSGAVTLYTDHFEPERHPGEVGVVALGEPLENLAVTRATRLRGGESGPGSERVLVTVANFAERARPARVRLVAGDEELAEKELVLEAGARKHFAFDVPAGTPPVEALLEGDAFEIDDSALLFAPPLHTLSLATTLDEAERRFLGLESAGAPGSGINRWLALVPESVQAPELERAHLAIAHGIVGGPATWCLALEEAPGERLDLVGPFLVEKRHPLLDGVSLDGVVWSASEGLVLPGTPLVTAGNLPLLTEERVDERLVFHANLDFHRSSLQRTPDWPILLDNLAELRRRELAGPLSTNLATGEVFRFKDDSPGEYLLRGPDGERELRARGTLVVDELFAVGAYRLERDGRAIAEFAVHFGDDAESDLRELGSGERLSSAELALQEAGSSWTVMGLLALALGAILFDWLVLRPRRRHAELLARMEAVS